MKSSAYEPGLKGGDFLQSIFNIKAEMIPKAYLSFLEFFFSADFFLFSFLTA